MRQACATTISRGPAHASVAERVLAIFGPTASGKTAVAEAIAGRIPAEIVSADAMQVYRGPPILTAQPERPTRLVAIWGLDHEASVGEYERLAHAAIDEVLAAGRTPIVAGGTGLYLRAALAELDLRPRPAGARERWEAFYDAEGPERAHEELRARDPTRPRPSTRTTAVVSCAPSSWPRRARRSSRAAGTSGRTRCGIRRSSSAWTSRGTSWSGASGPGRMKMFERGVEDEVRQALREPLSRTAGKVIGLREVAELPRADAIEAIVLRTRRYAAYQRKWMRRLPGLVVVPADRPAADVADEVLQRLHGNAAARPGVRRT